MSKSAWIYATVSILIIVTIVITAWDTNTIHIKSKPKLDKIITPKITPKITPEPIKIIPEDKYKKRITVWNKCASGKLKGYGETVVHLCGDELDPFLVLAIAKQETGNGTTPAIKYKNNPGGLMNSKGIIKFKSMYSGFKCMVKILKGYRVRGLSSISRIQKIYCPIGAKNDPTGLNKHWRPSVTKFYNGIMKEVRKSERVDN